MKITLYPKYFIRSLFIINEKDSFFSAGYQLLYPECSRHGMTPWQHYVLEGKRKGYDNGNHPFASSFFPEGYLAMYPDVARKGINPWRHYVLHGKKEGRDNGLHPKDDQIYIFNYKEA